MVLQLASDRCNSCFFFLLNHRLQRRKAYSFGGGMKAIFNCTWEAGGSIIKLYLHLYWKEERENQIVFSLGFGVSQSWSEFRAA